MKSSKMWHRNSSVHPLDASRGPATKEGSARWTTAWGQRYVLKHKTCNSFGWSCNRRRDVNHHAFQQLARILGKAWHLKLWVFFYLYQIGIADYLCLGQFMHLGVSFCSRSRIGLHLWIWKLDPQATYSRHGLLGIRKWMLDTEEKGCQKRRREN